MRQASNPITRRPLFNVIRRILVSALLKQGDGSVLQAGLGDPAACGLRFFHASEAEVVGSGVGLSLAASACDVARAVLIRAKEGASPLDTLPCPWFGGIQAIRGPLRIDGDLAGGRERLIVVG